MGISKKKRQFVRRNYPQLAVKDIAVQTGLSEDDVKKILGIDRQEKKANKKGQYDRLLGWAIVCCVFFAPFVMIPGLRDASNLAQNAFVQVTAMVVATAWVVKQIFVDQKLVFFPSPMIRPLGVFALFCLASVFWSTNRFEVFPVFLQTAAMGIFFLVVLQVCARKAFPDQPGANLAETVQPGSKLLPGLLCERIILALALAGGGIALIGICQYLFGFSMIPQARPPAATFANRNMASQFMVLVIPFGLYLVVKARSSATAWTGAMITGMMLVYVVYIQSLAGWVAVFLELFVFAGLTGYLVVKKRLVTDVGSRWMPVTAMALFFLVLINVNADGFHLRFGGLAQEIQKMQDFVGTTLPDEPGQAGQTTQTAGAGETVDKPQVSTLQWRWSIWRNSLAMIQDNPVQGVGAGNFKVIYPLYHQAVIKDQKFSIEAQPLHAHNDYIQAGTELGLVGLAIIVWTIGCFFTILAVLIRRSDKKNTLVLAVTILASGTGILINAGFSFPFQRAIPPYVVMVISAIAGAMFVQQKQIKPRTIHRGGWLYTLGAVMGIVSVFFVYFHYNRIQFDRYYGKSIASYNQSRWPAVLENGQKALAYGLGGHDLLYFYMGYAQNKMGNTSESIVYYNRLLETFPNYVNALINLGVAYGKSGMNEQAVAMYQQVVHIVPDRFEYYNDIGHYLLQSKKLDQAYDYFMKAAKLNGENATIQLNLGVVCLHMEKLDQAKQFFQNALALDPGWERPRQFLDQIKARENNTGISGG